MARTKNLFRFVTVRPPELGPTESVDELEDVHAGEVLMAEAEEHSLRQGQSIEVARRQVAEAVLESEQYWARQATWRQLRPARAGFMALLKAAAEGQDRTTVRGRAEELLEDQFGIRNLSSWMDSGTFATLKSTLWRSYYANVLAPQLRPADRNELVDWARVFRLLEACRHDSNAGPPELDRLAQALLRSRARVPGELFPDSGAAEAPPATAPDHGIEHIAELRARIDRQTAARLQVEELFHDRVAELRRRSAEDAYVDQAPEDARRREGESVREREAEGGEQQPQVVAGGLSPADAPWRLNALGLQRRVHLREELERLHLPVDGTFVTELAQRLDASIAADTSELAALLARRDALGIGPKPWEVGDRESSEPGGPAKPLVKPLGIGDLKVTKQVLVRYEPSEVAHIENVLAREKRHREHRRMRRVEEIVTLEREREEESRRDLQSTERFELESETQRTLKAETSLEAGIEISGGFGPVTVGAYARYANNQSKEESDTNSTKYAKEVVDKSMSRLLERVREERQVTTVEQVEENNSHGFENDGDTHITGVYRWVDKLYRQKVFNYGKRLMYEFVVPEPAAFYLFAQRYNYESTIAPVKPKRPTVPRTTLPWTQVHRFFDLGESELTPSDISRNNYLAIAAQSGAQGIQPPPPHRVVVSKAIARDAGQGQWSAAFTNEDLTIPKGYQAEYGSYQFVVVGGFVLPLFPAVIIGNHRLRFVNNPGYIIDFDGEIGRIPISGTAFRGGSIAINVEVSCVLTEEAYAAWKLDTYAKVMAAYQQALMDYEEKIAALQVQQGPIGGSNPALNRELEREELKRACLTIWAGSGIDVPDGIAHNPTAPIPSNYPYILRANVVQSAETVRFFEQAFDWRNMIYTLHPYFWSRESTWLNRSGLSSPDPLLERFMKAGAATVTVPVQPSFTEAVLWYQLTGEIWNGGPIPALSSTADPDAQLYNAYLEEITGLADVVDIDADIEIAADDPNAWIARIPTTLVWLQPEPDLPNLESEG